MITRSRSSKSRPSAPRQHRGHIVTRALILVLTAVPLAAQRPAPPNLRRPPGVSCRFNQKWITIGVPTPAQSHMNFEPS